MHQDRLLTVDTNLRRFLDGPLHPGVTLARATCVALTLSEAGQLAS
jgi:hypothetical protein